MLVMERFFVTCNYFLFRYSVKLVTRLLNYGPKVAPKVHNGTEQKCSWEFVQIFRCVFIFYVLSRQFGFRYFHDLLLPSYFPSSPPTPALSPLLNNNNKKSNIFGCLIIYLNWTQVFVNFSLLFDFRQTSIFKTEFPSTLETDLV